MARYECPQCGRGFASVSDMLSHTQSVHADDTLYADRIETAAPARTMPSAEAGPVATERASRTGFEVEPASPRPGPQPTRSPRRPSEDEDEDEQKQNPTLGTLIGLIVIAAIIILNLITGGGD